MNRIARRYVGVSWPNPANQPASKQRPMSQSYYDTKSKRRRGAQKGKFPSAFYWIVCLLGQYKDQCRRLKLFCRIIIDLIDCWLINTSEIKQKRYQDRELFVSKVFCLSNHILLLHSEHFAFNLEWKVGAAAIKETWLLGHVGRRWPRDDLKALSIVSSMAAIF